MLSDDGGATLRLINQSMENFPGPKAKTSTTTNKKRNWSAVRNLSGSLKIIFTLSRSAVRYATVSKIVNGMEISREEKPASIRQLALARQKKFPAPIQPEDQKQQRLQEAG
jgi:hypothetical protein